MKTILVIYTANTVTNNSTVAKYKRYAFNTKSDIEIGDLISSAAYTTSMQVVKVLSKSYKYYNAETGKLSDRFSSTKQWNIKELVIREDDSEVVYGSITNRR